MRYVFGVCTLDTAQYVLYRAHRSIALQPKVFQVLHYLLTHRDRVIAKPELSEQIWPEQFISDATLEGVIKAVRQAVGDDGRTQWCIQTRRGQGYRFVAPLVAAAARHEDAAVSMEAPVPASPPLRDPMPTALTSEVPETSRRQLTVLFCDLIDSTPLAVQLDPEDLRAVMLAYYAACAEVAQRFDGTIVQYLGDGLLLFFGYPQAHEDEAQRAIHTGLGILEALTTLNTRLHHDHGVHITARLGIHTGMVIVGQEAEHGTPHPMAFGDTPHIASRLQTLARANQVVISEPTWRLGGGGFDYEDLGVQALRGVATPLRVYHVRGTRGVVSRFDAATVSGLSALVGREEEVRLLLRRWQQAQAGEGQVVLLAGEAGMGKSRLARAVRETVATEPHTAVAYQCVPHYRHSAFYPLRVQLEDAAQFARHDTDAQKLDKLERFLAHIGADVADVAPLFAALLSLPTGDRYPALSLVPGRQRAKTIEALVGQIVGLAARQTVLCIVEDVQWSDPTTREVLDVLVHRVHTIRALVIITYRPEFAVSWRAATHVTALTLNRLDRAQSTVLVEQVTTGKALPEAVHSQIVAQADGMPLFVEELAKAVLESEWLYESADGYEVVGPLPLLAIPSTLQDTLMARLDRLGTAKAVAQLAATIGREFSAALLQAVLPADEDFLQGALTRLVEAEIIYPRGRHPDATYVFKHALIQGIASRSLLRQTRQGYHRTIAQVLAERFAETVETQPELLAHHYTEAGLPLEAVVYWQLAGKRAVQRGAHQEAVAFYEQALHALQQLPTTSDRLAQAIDLHLALEEALFPLGAFDRVCDTLREAERLAEALGDARRLGRVTEALSTSFRRLGTYDRAVTLARLAMALAADAGDGALQAWSTFRLGQAVYCLGDYPRASACFQKALVSPPAQTEDTGAPITLPAHARSWLVYCLTELGEFSEGLALGREAVRIAEAGEFSVSWCAAYTSLGYLSLVQGAFQAATAFLERGLDLCRRWHNLDWLPECAASLGLAYALAGRLGEALPLLEQAVAQETTMGGGHSATGLMALSQGYVLAGRLEEARAQGEQALALARERQERGSQAWALRLLGDIDAQSDPPQVEDASAAFQQACVLAEALAMRPLQAHCHQGLGTLYATTGQREQARAALVTAVELYRVMAMPFWLSRADAALAQVEAR